MLKKPNEAVVLLAKCGAHNRIYGMRTERCGRDKWRITWAFPIKEASAQREGYDRTSVRGDIQFADEYPGCPFCGGRALTLCSCGHLSCTNEVAGIFSCGWCGNQGYLGDYDGNQGISAGMDV